MKVVVVGAGTAGLAAVHRLRQAGVDVVAYDAAEQAGGRIAGAQREGCTLDLGAQFFFRFYETTFALCRELGLAEDIVSFPLRMAMARGGRLYPVTATPDPRLLWRYRRDFLRFRGVPWSGMVQFARILPLLLRRRHDLHFTGFENMLDLDGESLAGFARRRCGDAALEYLFQPVASAMTLGEPEEISAGYGLALLWYSLHGLYTLRHGIGALAQALYARHAAHVRLSTPVRRVVVEDGRVRGVETAAGRVDADAVICATTATGALALVPGMPPAMRRPLEQVTYSACCHAVFGVAGSPLPADCYAVGLPRHGGSLLAGITDNAMKSGHYAPPGRGLVHAFSHGRHARRLNALGDADIRSTLLAEVRRILPAMPGQPLFTAVRRWDEAVCLAPPGMLTAMQRLRRHHYRDLPGLFLAGEYLGMPSVEGALRSGLDAAAAVLRG